MNRTFVFVVLHYKVVDETEACIESLLKYNSKVIVVCNGENPNVLNLFSEKHVNNSQIEFVFNEQNLGFARGMNAGYLIAKDTYNADFIICMNNDVRILQEDFLHKIECNYNIYHFGVAGPDIVNLDNKHQNPRYTKIPTKRNVEKEINDLKRRIIGCQVFGGGPEIIHCVLKRFKIKKSNRNSFMNLHGACVIFGKPYIDKFDGLCNKTFLYGEEEILAYLCHKNLITMSYLADIQVIHHEAQSTKAELKNIVKRHLFYYQNLLESRKILYEMLDS